MYERRSLHGVVTENRRCDANIEDKMSIGIGKDIGKIKASLQI